VKPAVALILTQAVIGDKDKEKSKSKTKSKDRDTSNTVDFVPFDHYITQSHCILAHIGTNLEYEVPLLMSPPGQEAVPPPRE
jgi:hypothetical protein